MHGAFKSDTRLRSHLVQPKDMVYPSKQGGVAYKTPYKCGKVYIGETERAMQEKMKEHKRDDMTNTQTNLLFQRIKTTLATICLGTR